MGSTIKQKAFTFELYPDSATGGADCIELLKEFRVPFFAILHDKDINSDGTSKKPHYHIILIYGSATTVSNAQKVVDYMGGVRDPRDNFFAVNSLSGCCRYLVHKDNPEKYQYSADEVISYGGLDYLAKCQSNTDELEAVKEMRAFIRKNNILCLATFISYCDDNRPEWSHLLDKRYTYSIKEFMKSLQWSLEKSELNLTSIVDSDTGEVIYSI